MAIKGRERVNLMIRKAISYPPFWAGFVYG
jgi:hypothetical protein